MNKPKSNIDGLEEVVSSKLDKGELIKNLSNGNFSIVPINQLSSTSLDLFKKDFFTCLTTIYGDQEKSFQKLFSPDRTTLILCLEGKPAGIISFKKELQKEYSTLDPLKGYLEIKSLLITSGPHRGNGLIYVLINQLVESVKEGYLGKQLDGIVLTVSKNKANGSYELFKKLGFIPVSGQYGMYTPGNEEILMYYPVNREIHSEDWELTIKRPYFDAVKDGRKTTEGRSGSSFFKMKVNDRLVLLNGGERLIKPITSATHYGNLDDYLRNEGFRECIPWAKSVEDAKKEYARIPRYSEKIKKLGIIGFRF